MQIAFDRLIKILFLFFTIEKKFLVAILQLPIYFSMRCWYEKAIVIIGFRCKSR